MDVPHAQKSGLELAKIALQVATEASRLVLAGFRQPQTISFKGAREPFTQFDLDSEQLVRKRLAELTPDIPVVGEEGGGTPARLTWYCDPIDGTVNFMRGHPYFSVSLGLALEGQPFAGAVVAPALRLWWRGSVDDRAYRNEVPCRVSDTTNLADAVVTTGLPVRAPDARAASADLLLSFSPEVRDVRRCGSAAIDLCMVADGTNDVYFTRRLSPWDTCAGAAILLAAGGRFQTWPHAGREYELGSNGALHDAFTARLGEACPDRG